MESSFCTNNNVHTVSTVFHGFLGKADDTKVTMVICKQQQMHTGLDLQLWGPRGNQNVETPISNKKFRLYCNY
jgi:hypothetical protein